MGIFNPIQDMGWGVGERGKNVSYQVFIKFLIKTYFADIIKFAATFIKQPLKINKS